MKTLQLINKMFISSVLGGGNRMKSAQNAVGNFPELHLYINKDKYEEPSHVFYENFVLFFGGDIYQRQPK